MAGVAFTLWAEPGLGRGRETHCRRWTWERPHWNVSLNASVAFLFIFLISVAIGALWLFFFFQYLVKIYEVWLFIPQG